MKRVLLILFSIVLTLIMAGCKDNVSDKEGEKAAIRGQITKIAQNLENKTVTLLVEGQKEQDTEYDKASVTINSVTKIYKGNSKGQLFMTDLKEGIKVEIYWNGPVRESYPVQMGANIIRILE